VLPSSGIVTMLHNVPTIFDNSLFKLKIKHLHHAVIQLQDLLNDILRQRLGLFSRNFSLQVHHDFTKCLAIESHIEIDPEALPFKHHSFDLVVSAGPLMITNDIPGVLKQWCAILNPGGVFMASFVGEDSLMELKNCFLNVEEALGLPHYLRFFPTIATKDAGMLMQRAGFHLPTADRTRHMFQVESLSKLLSLLKAMGGNVLYDRSNMALTKKFLKSVEEEYFKRYSSEGQLNVTIDIVCMTGWAIERYAEERIQQDTPKTIGFL